MKKKFLSSLFAIGMIAAALVWSCSKKDDPIAVTGVQLSDNEIVITEGGGTATLTATILPENADNKAVTWASSDPEKVSVNENGVVTALAEEGTATIIVTTQDGGKTAFCKVKIEKKIAVTDVTLPKTFLIMGGSTAVFTATITPRNATDKAVRWTSDNENIATIDANGRVTAKSIGETTIKVTTRDGNKTATCSVKVIPATVIAPSATHYITMVTQKPTTQKLELTIKVANEADKAGIWIDLNNNGKKDTGEEITNFTSKQEYQFTSPIITLYGKVTYLVCSNNQLFQLDISHNTDLVMLSSYRNHITTIDLTKNIGLQELYSYDASLTELDLSQNTNLKRLELGYNELKDLNLKAQKELTDLRVPHNQLTTLDVSQNTKLREISCYENQIKGTGMDNLIAHLPTREATNKGKLYVKNEMYSGEQNEITATQIAAAKAKNWRVFVIPKGINNWAEP